MSYEKKIDLSTLENWQAPQNYPAKGHLTSDEIGNSLELDKDLRAGDVLIIKDDKDRSIKVRLGKAIDRQITDTRTGLQTTVKAVLVEILKFEGVDLEKIELITPCIYLEGTDRISLHPKRASGAVSPAKSNGLRVAVNPWQIFPVAPSFIEVVSTREQKQTEEISCQPGETMMLNIFKQGDKVEMTDYRGRTYIFTVSRVFDGQCTYATFSRNKRIIAVDGLRSDDAVANVRIRQFSDMIPFALGGIKYTSLGYVVVSGRENDVSLINPDEHTKKRVELGYVSEDGDSILVSDKLSQLPKLSTALSKVTIRRTSS